MDKPRLPLEGYRVVDLGIITAGAATSALLADLGAEVIKVESGDYIDPFRYWEAPGATAADWWNHSPQFRFTNRNKLGISINLKHPRGRETFLRLVARSHLVVENFRRGVLERLGITFQVLQQANPRIVLASISSQGETGPERYAVSYGSTLEATGGLAYFTGYADGPPTVTGRHMNYPDQVVSMFSVGAILVALLHTKQTGKGVHLDISQRELTSFLLGEELVARWWANESGEQEAVVPARRGNDDPTVAHQACYQDVTGRWVAVTLQDQRDVDQVAASLPLPLDQWIASRTASEACETLRALGIAAAPVNTGRDMLTDPVLTSGWFLQKLPVPGPSAGETVKGFPFQMKRTPMSVTRPAPALGEHTDHVLKHILGLSDEEIAQLRVEGIVSKSPRPQTTR